MKNTLPIHFTFVNSNSPAVFEENLSKILLEKLLAAFACSGALPAAN